MITLHALAVAALLVSQVAWTLKVVLVAILVFSFAQCLRRHVLRSGADAVDELILLKDGEVELIFRDGSRVCTRFDSTSTVLHWLIAMRLRHEKKVLSVFLLPDMMDREAWRRLSVSLRRTKPGN